jgi:hypothetical protein
MITVPGDNRDMGMYIGDTCVRRQRKHKRAVFASNYITNMTGHFII